MKLAKKWRSFGNICWFTNLDVAKRHEELILYKHYNPEEYPHYDNYDAINVNVTADIPMDYYGAMWVPITFLDKYNPDQFEIIKFRKGDDDKDLSVNGKCPYFRILIRRRQNNIINYQQQQESELPMAAEEQAKYNKLWR